MASMPWRLSFFILFLCVAVSKWLHILHLPTAAAAASKSWTEERKLAFRERTRDLWMHGFSQYMKHGWPDDELRPLSCTGRGPDYENPHNHVNNDVAGNFSLTLIDVLDTFIVLNDQAAFESAVRKVIERVSFNSNTKPQVFETNIRVLGGLLSAHIFASREDHPFHLKWYRGELLELAYDLGKRLLPAFLTPTGIPYARINLRHGLVTGETVETCTAGAGSLIIEFATLSRLTGDPRFEKAAYKAFFAIYNRKSDLNLVGNNINAWTGQWISPEVSSIGAGIDSFFEYALKWYIMSGEVEFLDAWHESYAAVMRYSRGPEGFWYRKVNIYTGELQYATVDSLSAFWPGLQVLAGDIENAIKSHLIYWNLWKRHSGLPEVWDINFAQATALQYPLRPEFVESTYFLYRATKDSFYLDVGERILSDIQRRSQVPCGLTGILNLAHNERDDRMESFVLSETLKYLFLLFDEENPLNSDDSNFVFTTEGHIFQLPNQHLKALSPVRRKLRKNENLQCPVHNPVDHLPEEAEDPYGLSKSVRARPDVDYARYVVGANWSDDEEKWWSPHGWCELPKTELFSYDFILSSDGTVTKEDFTPGSHKMLRVDDGFVLNNVTGIRAHIVSRLDGRGYDVTKLGPFAVRTGEKVYVNDTTLFAPRSDPSDERIGTVNLHFSLSGEHSGIPDIPRVADTSDGFVATAWTALFAGDPVASPSTSRSNSLAFRSPTGSPLSSLFMQTDGCGIYPTGTVDIGSVLVVQRGGCPFVQKLLRAKDAGAVGIIVISDNDADLNASCSSEEETMAQETLNDVVLVVLSKTLGEELALLCERASQSLERNIMVAVVPEGDAGAAGEGKDAHGHLEDEPAHNRIMYINGLPLINTRLIV